MTTANDPSRAIEYRGLDSLVPDPRNPKSHSLETIDASIGRFGVVDPIVLDGRTGFIISGHGRAKTLQTMHARGEGAPEGVNITTKGKWEVPVSVGWSSRTDTEAAAALVALNRTTELGGWVDEELLTLLDDLNSYDDGLDGVGFGPEDIEALEALTGRLNADGPRDLDALADEFGDPTDEDHLERVVLILDDSTASQVKAHLSGFDNHSAAVRDWLDHDN